MEGRAVHDDAFYVPPEMLSARGLGSRPPLPGVAIENAGFAEREDDKLQAEVKALLNDDLRRAEGLTASVPRLGGRGVYA